MDTSEALQVIRPAPQDENPTPLQQHLWSKLPIEVVFNIITKSTFQSTQDAWCLATKGSSQLHETAMRTKWHSTTIDERDLLPAPGEDEIRFDRVQTILMKHNISNDWKQAGYMLNELMVTDESGRCPAYYVQSVIFDFRMLRWLTNRVLDIGEEDEDGHQLMPSLKSAEYTLKLLKEYLHNPVQITCLGDTPLRLLDFVSKHATSVQVLELRLSGRFGALYIPSRDEPDHRIYPSCRLPLDLTLLSTLQQLVHLDIHRLSNFEAAALRVTFPKLIKLQTLLLACEGAEHDSPKGCAFKVLFSDAHEQSSETVIWAPQSLQHLSIIDAQWHNRKIDVQIQPPGLEFPDSIRYLNLDLQQPSLLTGILERINIGSLNFLAVPEYYTSIVGSSGQSQLSDFLHQSSNSLNNIRVLGAWDFENDQLASLQSFQDCYTVGDLVLGTRNGSYYTGFVYTWKEDIPYPSLGDYLYGFSSLGYEDMTEKWGKTLRRVRIDHIDIVHDLDVSILSQDSWQDLKILMLQPASRHSIALEQQQSPKLVDQTICDNLAKHIATEGPQSLCVLVIGSHWYWIQRGSVGTKSSLNLWSWWAAKTDELQATMIDSLLNKSDLDFLENKDVPYWHERDMMEWHRHLASHTRTMPYHPTHEMMNQWNYLTLYPVHTT